MRARIVSALTRHGEGTSIRGVAIRANRHVAIIHPHVVISQGEGRRYIRAPEPHVGEHRTQAQVAIVRDAVTGDPQAKPGQGIIRPGRRFGVGTAGVNRPIQHAVGIQAVIYRGGMFGTRVFAERGRGAGEDLGADAGIRGATPRTRIPPDGHRLHRAHIGGPRDRREAREIRTLAALGGPQCIVGPRVPVVSPGGKFVHALKIGRADATIIDGEVRRWTIRDGHERGHSAEPRAIV